MSRINPNKLRTNAIETSIAFNLDAPELNHITLPLIPDEAMIEKLVSDSLDRN